METNGNKSQIIGEVKWHSKMTSGTRPTLTTGNHKHIRPMSRYDNHRVINMKCWILFKFSFIFHFYNFPKYEFQHYVIKDKINVIIIV